MLNFSVGPVQSDEAVLAIGSEQVPYFRTAEFSAIMKENERLFLKFCDAPAGSRAVFLTASGSGAMEASVINLLDKNDKALVVNGGSFGARFEKLLCVHEIPHEVIRLDSGMPLTVSDLEPFEDAGYTAFLVNLGETSTGVLYDIDLIHRFCERNGLFLIVDAISAFLAEEISMRASAIDVLITGSQKALACPPGISLLALAPTALERVARIDSKCLYLDLEDALKNGERGQTPFTPAVSILLQINKRLLQIDEMGFENEVQRVWAQAADFRQRIAHLPFRPFTSSPAHAVTSLLVPEGVSAKELFDIIKDEHDIWICPNGGELAEKVFRVGHIGALTVADNEALVAVFDQLAAAGLLSGEEEPQC